MIGAIFGDMVGSRFEFKEHHKKKFELMHSDCRFTDDTVLTCAIAKTLLDFRFRKDFFNTACENLSEFTRRYPDRGFGKKFLNWAMSEEKNPYGSVGNGSSMRVSPIANAFVSKDDVIFFARLQSMTTHNSKPAIKASETLSYAIYLAKYISDKEELREEISKFSNYDLDLSVRKLKHKLDRSYRAEDTVPAAIISFLESGDFYDAIRNAVSIGGDTDTIASMTGAICESFYGVDEDIRDFVYKNLDSYLLKVVKDFYEYFNHEKINGFGGLF